MHNLLQPFIFTGAQVAGDAVYIALWGGAGSSVHHAHESRNRWCVVNPQGGSGGLILAKIVGLGGADVCKVYVGGRGGVGASNYIRSTAYLCGPAPDTGSTRRAFADGASSGAASALTIQVGGTATEEFLLVAPSGGGPGGAQKTPYKAAWTSKYGGHGTFASVDLGRATVAPPSRSIGVVDKYTPEPGSLGAETLLGTIPAALNGSEGEKYQGGGGYRPGRGGGGAPDGAAGVNTGSRTKGDGGSGGKGFIHGGPATGAQETLYSTTYSNHGANITIEAVGIDGREIRPYDANYDSQFDRVAALRSGGGALGDFVTEVTDALGWATATGSEINWPPQLGDRSATSSTAQSIADPAQLTRRTVKTYPGQGGQRFYDNSAAFTTANDANARNGLTNWHANGGAAMLRFEADGACIGMAADDYRGAYSDGLTDSATETVWSPAADSSNLLTRDDSPTTYSFGVAFGGDVATNKIQSPLLYTDNVSAHLSATASATFADLNLGPIALGQGASSNNPVFYQVRDSSATLYEIDISAASPALATSTAWTGIEALSASRRALAVDDNNNLVYNAAAEHYVVSNYDATPTATLRPTTGSALLNSFQRGLCFDQFGFAYAGDSSGNIDVFEVGDNGNTSDLILTQSTVITGPVISMTYDPEHDLLYVSSNGIVSPIAIVRNSSFEPTLLQDMNVGSSTQVARTIGTANGGNVQMFYAGQDTVVQQDNNDLRLLDVSGAQPNRSFIPSQTTVGRYLRLTDKSQFMECNVAPPATIQGVSLVLVLRFNSSQIFPPWFTFYLPGGGLADHQCFGRTSNTRIGLFEADGNPHRGIASSLGYAQGQWMMLGFNWTGTTYGTSAGPYHNGAYSRSGAGGSNASTTVNAFTNYTTMFGINDSSFAYNINVDIAFARMYGANLTAAQYQDVWDHWCERNSAIFPANGQAVPAYNTGKADFLNNLYAEWDFSKMIGQGARTTQGNAGVVNGTLNGGAQII